MALALSTPHTHSRSLSSHRHNRTPSSKHAKDALATTASPIGMADNLPSVDFGFEDLKARMSQFTARFDEFIERGRKRVLEERNEFRVRSMELEETQASHLKSLTHIQSLLSTHSQTLASHQHEKSDLLSTISQITTRHTTVLSQRDRLRQQIADAQKQIDARLAAQKDYQRKIDGMARMNEPELNFWESHLGVRIEGGGGIDRLRVVYWMLGSNNSSSEHQHQNNNTRKTLTGGLQSLQDSSTQPEGEAFFDLSTAKRDYEILQCRPRLDKSKIEDVVEKLNSTRDFGAFLKGMRGLFVEKGAEGK